MRRALLHLLALAPLAGCLSQPERPANVEPRILSRLRVGMTQQEVKRILAEQPPPSPSLFEQEKLFLATAPYRTQTLTGTGGGLKVLHYRIYICQDSKMGLYAVTDGPTVPLVFDNGKLIGWGRRFLKEKSQKAERR